MTGIARLMVAAIAAVALGGAAPGPVETAIRAAPTGSYAVFDADNTIWNHDLEEALLPFLENRGTLSVATLDPALKPVPLLPGESLYGYYLRLCEIDDKVCYPWIAQVFAGRTLAALKVDVDALMAERKRRGDERGWVIATPVSLQATSPRH
ncbi:MAG: hypothetical protein JWR85_3941 [Marmoricola sp.]|nr:hypothetical protein [Marmoricola sp.]